MFENLFLWLEDDKYVVEISGFIDFGCLVVNVMKLLFEMDLIGENGLNKDWMIKVIFKFDGN